MCAYKRNENHKLSHCLMNNEPNTKRRNNKAINLDFCCLFSNNIYFVLCFSVL